MEQYVVSVEKQTFSEGVKYPAKEVIFLQVVDGVDLGMLAALINKRD